jgi:hypothetical protein
MDSKIRTALLKQTKKALSVDGFMLVTGLGVSPATIARQLAIAQHLTTGTPREVKERFTAKMSAGSYRGYKLQGIWNKEGGVPDNIEVCPLEPLNPYVEGILTVYLPTALQLRKRVFRSYRLPTPGDYRPIHT